MNKKKITSFKSLSALVYSTDPDAKLGNEAFEETEVPPNAKQKLRVWIETKHRGGKAVTIVQGYQGKNEELEDLGKQLKQACGTGGSVKEGEILIQGDHRDKVVQWLLKAGYTQTKKAGG